MRSISKLDNKPIVRLGEGVLGRDGFLSLPIYENRDLIIQWGKVNIDYAGEHSPYSVVGGSVNRYSGAASFPIPFPNSLLSVSASSNDVVNAYIASIYSYTPNIFQWSYHSTTAYTSNSGGRGAFSWIAIGY
ncbi:gp53-like domain-containing protein [Hafnia alvei]|uniref:gp53-like domain-containing protein n=1 Tax=Hafnia alvei TaxID=569 RepID=UPI00398B1A0A